jgi:hypothetical protein
MTSQRKRMDNFVRMQFVGTDKPKDAIERVIQKNDPVKFDYAVMEHYYLCGNCTMWHSEIQIIKFGKN